MTHSNLRRTPLFVAGTISVLLVMAFVATADSAATSRAAFRWNHVPGAPSITGSANDGRQESIIGAPVWKTIVLRELFGPKFTFVDVGESGDSPGDYGVFRDQVANDSNGKVVGTIDVQCIEAYASQCRGSVRLDNRGQITFDGITPSSVDPDRFAITGGTGEFVDVGGVFKVEFPSDDYALLTLTLTH